MNNENCDLTQGVDEIQLLKEKVEALTEIIHNPNFVLVVRCKDCKYNGGDCERCLNPNLPIVGDDATYLSIDPDWYCADGKRRKGNEFKRNKSCD